MRHFLNTPVRPRLWSFGPPALAVEQASLKVFFSSLLVLRPENN